MEANNVESYGTELEKLSCNCGCVGKCMATEAEQLRAQATRLFARAIQARDQGRFDLAEVLTAAAERSLENAAALEAAALVTVPQAGQQPVAQQQQQIQPDKEEPGTEAKLPDERKP